MKEFNNEKEIEKYYNKDYKEYKFKEGGKLLDIKFNFDFKYCERSIICGDIKGRNINGRNIEASKVMVSGNIQGCDIFVRDICAKTIRGFVIRATGSIFSRGVYGGSIYANYITTDEIGFSDECVGTNIECNRIRHYVCRKIKDKKYIKRGGFMIDELNIERELEVHPTQDVIKKIYNHLEYTKDYLGYLQYHLEKIAKNNDDIKIPKHLSYFIEDIKKHNDIKN